MDKALMYSDKSNLVSDVALLLELGNNFEGVFEGGRTPLEFLNAQSGHLLCNQGIEKTRNLDRTLIGQRLLDFIETIHLGHLAHF
jgi:hypothetical protein